MKFRIQRAILIGPRGGRVRGLVALYTDGAVAGMANDRKVSGLVDTLWKAGWRSVEWEEVHGTYPYDLSVRRFEEGLDPVHLLDRTRSHT